MASYFVPCAQVVFIFPMLYHISWEYPQFSMDNHLPLPKKPWMFMLNALLWISSIIFQIDLIVPVFKTDSQLYSSLLVLLAVYYLAMIISTFVISVCLHHFSARITEIIRHSISIWHYINVKYNSFLLHLSGPAFFLILKDPSHPFCFYMTYL